MDAASKLACNILSIIVVVGAIVFNICGIYILKAAKVGRSNQVLIIISLSIADILNSLGFICQISVELSGHAALDSKAGLIVWMIRAVIYHPWYTMFYLLTLDRFLACNFPFKYRSISGKNTMRNLLIFLWIFGLIPAPIYCFLDMEKIRVFYDQFVWVAFDVIFVVLFVVTYGSLFYRKKRSNLQFRHKDTNDDNHRFFIVTTVILVGFVFFAIIPDLAMSILHSYAEETSIQAQPVFELWWNINMLIDPFIYVFLQPRFRKIALTKIRGLCTLKRRRNRSLGTETGQGTGSTSDGVNRSHEAPPAVHYVSAEINCKKPLSFDNPISETP
eukprot:gene11622-21864_t